MASPEQLNKNLTRTDSDTQPLDEVKRNVDKDPNARLRPDQTGKVKMDNKANPTKPQQVHGDNVNRTTHSSGA